MITDIAYLEMRVRDFDECRDVYTRELGMTEIQDTTSEPDEHGEWISTVSAEDGNRESVIQVGNSFLILMKLIMLSHNFYLMVNSLIHHFRRVQLVIILFILKVMIMHFLILKIS